MLRDQQSPGIQFTMVMIDIDFACIRCCRQYYDDCIHFVAQMSVKYVEIQQVRDLLYNALTIPCIVFK